jgi:protease I
MHDFEPGWDTYVERPGYGLEAHAAISDLRAADLDALVLLGGRAPEYLRHNRPLLEVVRQMDAEGKWLFSICHGIQVLVAAGVVSGRAVTCYEHVRSEVESAGGRFVDEQATRDGHIVSAQTWESHPEFYREIFRGLRSGVEQAKTRIAAKL